MTIPLCTQHCVRARGGDTGLGRRFLFKEESMRTIAYVDGQNLYFSCLKGTAFKWLDLERLLKRIVCEVKPESELISIRYFTSPIKGNLARHGKISAHAQAEYLRALKCNPMIDIIEGRFSVRGVHALRHLIPPDLTARVRIWRAEEKETDVSIAMAMYRDARDGAADHLVLVTNDSDLLPALRAIRDDATVMVGVILPLKKKVASESAAPRPSTSLALHADWLLPHIAEADLAACQLAPLIHTRRRPARRPAHW